MKYLQVTPETTLSDLADIVGERNVDYVLNVNNLTRSVNIGKQVFNRDTTGSVDWQSKSSILNTLVGSSDVYEKAALGTEDDWVSLYRYGSFRDCIRIPDDIAVAFSNTILGNDEPISQTIYDACSEKLKGQGHVIDPEVFSEYNSLSSGAYNSFTDSISRDRAPDNPFEWFQLPWGKVSLHSWLSNETKDFPVYPEEFSDGYNATYDQMPQMLYQYEPWQVYKSSGPRAPKFTFHMHRDMWTGDHRDGLANELVRFCEANCFPKYNGSAVNAPRVVLYVSGFKLISGIITSCNVDWGGPLGLDGWYLELTLHLEITEVSTEPLNFDTVRNKGLIS